MSLTASLNNALAGLSLSSRRAEVISSNVANADTPGYARRRLSAAGPVTGVPSGQVVVTRDSDPALRFLRRDAQSEAAAASVSAAFFGRIDREIGDPDQSGSLQDLLSRLEAAFTSASADPTSMIRLQAVAQSAADLTGKFHAVGDAILQERDTAETAISTTVDRLNTDLRSVAQLNVDIMRLRATNSDASSLLDQRQLLVDRISEDVPIRELQRDNGTIALVSQGGVILLDGRPAEIGFSSRSFLEPGMTYPDQLSGLTVNGRDVGTGQTGDGLAGGRLGALFTQRDHESVQLLESVDALAADVMARFQDPTTDVTLGIGDAGLFTDDGVGLDVSSAGAGLSRRIQLTSEIDLGDPSTLWRLRDGIGAAAPGPTHAGDQLARFSDALSNVQQPSIAGLGEQEADLSGLAARLKSSASQSRVAAEDRFERLDRDAAALLELRDGAQVDIDEEMRRLIEVEQAYAANARLVQAVGQMMDRLTEI